MFENLVKIMDSYLEQGLPGYDCIICKDGKEIFRHRNGYCNLETKEPMTGKERFNIYSCSKVITCTAAMQLWEKGLFSLEDKLSDYLPEFKEMTVKTENGIRKAEKPILIRQLFGMAAGFSYDTRSPQILKCMEDTHGECPTRTVMEYLAKEPLLFEPGDRFEYSLCHDVLAALVEVLSGMKFGDYVKKNIFDVLGMTHSTYLLPDEQLDTVDQQYRFCNETKQARNTGKRIEPYKLGSKYESGGAGCVSTLEDYIKFLEALRHGEKILKRETIALMMTDQLTQRQREDFWLKEDYGYGLGVRCPKAGGTRTDFGWDGAAGSYLVIDIPKGITMFYAQHMLDSTFDRAALYGEVLKEING